MNDLRDRPDLKSLLMGEAPQNKSVSEIETLLRQEDEPAGGRTLSLQTDRLAESKIFESFRGRVRICNRTSTNLSLIDDLCQILINKNGTSRRSSHYVTEKEQFNNRIA
jgi:hypothetical protein